MTPLALIRHGLTDWGEAGLIQGRADRPLSPAGRAQLAASRLPAEFAGFDWVSSPLARAAETAAVLLGRTVPAEPLLIEADWGDWQGRRLDDIRAELGAALARIEQQGLDFRPPGGESPREVQARLASWLAQVARRGLPAGAVCHKGVIRAALGLATGWDFLGKPPARLRDDCVHLFVLAPDGSLRLDRPNIPLEPRR